MLEPKSESVHQERRTQKAVQQKLQPWKRNWPPQNAVTLEAGWTTSFEKEKWKPDLPPLGIPEGELVLMTASSHPAFVQIKILDTSPHETAQDKSLGSG